MCKLITLKNVFGFNILIKFILTFKISFLNILYYKI